MIVKQRRASNAFTQSIIIFSKEKHCLFRGLLLLLLREDSSRRSSRPRSLRHKIPPRYISHNQGYIVLFLVTRKRPSRNTSSSVSRNSRKSRNSRSHQNSFETRSITRDSLESQFLHVYYFGSE